MRSSLYRVWIAGDRHTPTSYRYSPVAGFPSVLVHIPRQPMEYILAPFLFLREPQSSICDHLLALSLETLNSVPWAAQVPTLCVEKHISKNPFLKRDSGCPITYQEDIHPGEDRNFHLFFSLFQSQHLLQCPTHKRHSINIC